MMTADFDLGNLTPAGMSRQPGAPMIGVQIIQSAAAMQTGPRFPLKKWTKRRRRRVIGKHGSWHVQRPACFMFDGKIIVHPSLYAVIAAGALRWHGVV